MALNDDRWLEAARAADRARVEAPLSPAADARIRASIRARGKGEARRSWAVPALAFATGAALMAIILGPRAVPEPTPARDVVGSTNFVKTEACCTSRSEGDHAGRALVLDEGGAGHGGTGGGAAASCAGCGRRRDG